MSRRIVQLVLGVFLYGIAISLILRGAVGVAPWDVLSQGLSKQTGLSFGTLTVIISGVVLLLWIPIRQKPGIGTVVNALVVGPSAEVGLAVIPVVDDLLLRIVLFAGGLLLLAFATGLYIGARFGPGPRDGLMTGIHHRWGIKIWIVRTSLEVVVLSIGWLLGGNVGVGTVAFALLIGPMVNITMPLLMVPAAVSPAGTAPAGTAPAAEQSADHASHPRDAEN
ncbi:MAG: YczE/YyaS/YitT family protein [Microbacteriaceae bacterium]